MLVATRTFLRAVEAGSFSAAAREAGVGQPTISKQIAALEAHLGVQLVTRSTRALALTDEGRRFLDGANAAVDAFAAAEAAARGEGSVEGRLRVGCPVAFGQLHVVPHLPALLAAHPALSVELFMTDAILDPVEQGVDLSVRVGNLRDSALRARRIGTARRVTVAAPDYLATRGRPDHPNELRDHDCVIFSRLQTGAAWPYRDGEAELLVPVNGRLRADNSTAVRDAAVAGCGIALLPFWLVGRSIEAGALVRLLEPFEPEPYPISLVTPPRRFTPPRVAAFGDHLAKLYRADPCLG
ncbi:MAG: LysR family transcriptional regulator [Pseudomonadota bacterium]